MRAAPWIWYLWPGAARLWLRGDWSGLVLAGVFTALANFALLTNFVWPQLVGPAARTAAWLATVCLWLLSGWMLHRRRSEFVGQPGVGLAEDLLREAQSEYLKRNWFQAESLLRRLLRTEPRDVEARLLLATLYRHTRRSREARRELRRLERMEQAETWQMEIQQELRQLDAVQSDPSHGGPVPEKRCDTAASQRATDVPEAA